MHRCEIFNRGMELVGYIEFPKESRVVKKALAKGKEDKVCMKSLEKIFHKNIFNIRGDIHFTYLDPKRGLRIEKHYPLGACPNCSMGHECCVCDDDTTETFPIIAEFEDSVVVVAFD